MDPLSGSSHVKFGMGRWVLSPRMESSSVARDAGNKRAAETSVLHLNSASVLYFGLVGK